MDPVAEPIELPEGYGKATATMDWAAVQARARSAFPTDVTRFRFGRAG